MRNVLILLILAFASISYAKNYPISEQTGKEYVPFFSVDGYAYIFTDESETAVKFVEPYEHISMAPDSFTAYRQQNIDIPDSILYEGKFYDVVAIEREALSHPMLLSLTIPSSVKIIEPYAVECWICENIAIKNGVKKIMNGNFNRCDKAEIDLVLPSSLHEIQSDCFNNSGYKTIVIEEGLEYLGDECFCGNWNLTSIKLPETLRSIGKNCFKKCRNLKKINIPRWLDRGDTFDKIISNLGSIEEIHFSTPAPDYCSEHYIEKLKFDVSKCKLIIPDGCTETYKERGWGVFQIIEVKDSSVENNIIEKAKTADVEYYNINGIKLDSDSNIRERSRLQKKGANGVVIVLK